MTSRPRLVINPTLIGLVAVVVWGVALPVMRILAERLGVPVVIGTVFAGAGCLGLLNQWARGQAWPSKAVFCNPYLYGRWLFFVMHEVFICTAIVIVTKSHVPLVILLNYFWPTAVIVCCVLFAGVRITRWPFFIVGTLIVLGSLSAEILAPGALVNLFVAPFDGIAYLLAFIGAIAWGLYCALSRRAGDATGGGAVIPFFQLTLGLALVLSFMPGLSHWDHLTPGLAGGLVAWCIVQFCAYLSWDFGMRRGSVVALSLSADFIPWLSLAASVVLVDIPIGGKTIVSALSLVAGAVIARYGTLKKRLAATDEPPVV